MDRRSKIKSTAPSNSAPLFRQVYGRVRDMIAKRQLRAGDRIPSSRSFASELGIARGTIEEAYQLLAAEGYIVRRGSAGSFVSADLPGDDEMQWQVKRQPPHPRPLGGLRSGESEPRSPFQMGLPALDLFPKAVWSRHLARHVRRCDSDDFHYAGPFGFTPLREAIAQYLSLARGVACGAEQIVITLGFHGALRLTAEVLIRPGCKVWVEDPGFPVSRHVLAASGAALAPVPVDNEGLVVSEGRRLARDARIALVTPSHQFPTCAPMSLARRGALLEWAAHNDAWIVEDDYDGEFHYVGRPLPALKSIDTQDRVLYAGSFSKTLYPGLRMGYLVVPSALCARFAAALPVSGVGPPTLLQRAVADFIDDGHFVRHLRRMRTLYERRRDSLLPALDEVFGMTLRVDEANGGLHLIAGLPQGVSDRRIAKAAALSGLAVQCLSQHYARPLGRSGLLLPFTNIPERSAIKLAKKLHKAVEAFI